MEGAVEWAAFQQVQRRLCGLAQQWINPTEPRQVLDGQGIGFAVRRVIPVVRRLSIKFCHVLDRGYDCGYTPLMKTAISIPDPIFEAAELLANRLGMSRSQLYTTAITRFLDSFDEEAITQALNEVYEESPESIDPLLMQLQIQSLPKEQW